MKPVAAASIAPRGLAFPSLEERPVATRITTVTTRRAIRGADLWLTGVLVGVPMASALLAWTSWPWQAAVWGLVCLTAGLFTAMREWKRSAVVESPGLLLIVLAFPAFGLLQLLFMHPAYRFATQKATVGWAALAALTFTGIHVLRSSRNRDLFLSGLLWFGAAASVLEIIQVFGYERYRTMASGYPLFSSNYFAEVIELILPIALTRAFRRPGQTFAYAGLSTVFIATVFASSARAGSILVLLEVLVVFGVAFRRWVLLRKRLIALAIVIPVLLAGLLALESPGTLIQRLHESDPLAARKEIGQSALAIFKAHPLVGTGLGTFPFVYPAFASFDNGYFINHTHDDWLEFAAEGGLILPACLLLLVVIVAPAAWKSGWGIGIFAILLHATVDFPLQRFGVASTLFVLLPAVMASENRRVRSRAAHLSSGVPLKS